MLYRNSEKLKREILLTSIFQKKKEVVIGIVQRMEKKNVIVQLGKIDAIYWLPNEQIPGEQYRFMDRVKGLCCGS